MRYNIRADNTLLIARLTPQTTHCDGIQILNQAAVHQSVKSQSRVDNKKTVQLASTVARAAGSRKQLVLHYMPPSGTTLRCRIGVPPMYNPAPLAASRTGQ